MLLFLLLLSLILTTVNGEVDSVRSRLLAAQGIKELKYSWFEDVNCQAGGCIFGDDSSYCYKCLDIPELPVCDMIERIHSNQKSSYGQPSIPLMKYSSLSVGYRKKEVNENFQTLVLNFWKQRQLDLKTFGHCKRFYMAEDTNSTAGNKDENVKAYIRFEIMIGTTVKTTSQSRKQGDKKKQRIFSLGWGNGWSKRRESGLDVDEILVTIFDDSFTLLDAASLQPALAKARAGRKNDLGLMYIQTAYDKEVEQLRASQDTGIPELLAILPLEGKYSNNVKIKKAFPGATMEVAQIGIFDGDGKPVDTNKTYHELYTTFQQMASRSCIIVTCPKAEKKEINLSNYRNSIQLEMKNLYKLVVSKYRKDKKGRHIEHLKNGVSFAAQVSSLIRNAKELPHYLKEEQDQTGVLEGLTTECKSSSLNVMGQLREALQSALRQYASGRDDVEKQEVPDHQPNGNEIASLMQLHR